MGWTVFTLGLLLGTVAPASVERHEYRPRTPAGFADAAAVEAAVGAWHGELTCPTADQVKAAQGDPGALRRVALYTTRPLSGASTAVLDSLVRAALDQAFELCPLADPATGRASGVVGAVEVRSAADSAGAAGWIRAETFRETYGGFDQWSEDGLFPSAEPAQPPDATPAERHTVQGPEVVPIYGGGFATDAEIRAAVGIPTISLEACSTDDKFEDNREVLIDINAAALPSGRVVDGLLLRAARLAWTDCPRPYLSLNTDQPNGDFHYNIKRVDIALKGQRVLRTDLGGYVGGDYALWSSSKPYAWSKVADLRQREQEIEQAAQARELSARRYAAFKENTNRQAAWSFLFFGLLGLGWLVGKLSSGGGGGGGGGGERATTSTHATGSPGPSEDVLAFWHNRGQSDAARGVLDEPWHVDPTEPDAHYWGRREAYRHGHRSGTRDQS